MAELRSLLTLICAHFLSALAVVAQPAAAPGPPFTLGGKPVAFDWGLDFPGIDVESTTKYEDEIWSMLTSPLEDWQQIPAERDFTFAVRPIKAAGVPGVLSYYTTQHRCEGGRAFLEFLTTAEGYVLLDPLTEQEGPLAAAVRFEGPNGWKVYPLAQPSLVGPSPTVLVSAVHTPLCGERQLTLFNYPTEVPLEDRLPEVAALSGEVPDTTLVFALRVEQRDAGSIDVTSIVWFQVPPIPDEIVVELALQFYEGLWDRFSEHLAETEYSPESGDECAAFDGDGGVGPGAYGDGENGYYGEM